VLSHLIRIRIYAAPLREHRSDFCISRELPGIGFGEPALYFLDLPRFRFYERFERAVDDP
jgi:hypothetical protein